MKSEITPIIRMEEYLHQCFLYTTPGYLAMRTFGTFGTFGTNMLQNVQLTVVAFLRDLTCLWNTIERYGSGGTSNMVLYNLHPISG